MNGTFAGGVRLRDGVVPKGTQLRVGDTLVIVDAAHAAASDPEDQMELTGLVFSSADEAFQKRSRKPIAPVA